MGKILEASNALEKLEAALHASHKSGKDLKFVSDQTDPPVDGVSESGKLKSHLPTPAHRLISERKLYDFDTIRTLLGSALNVEGFGRGSGKLRYKEPENCPKWFDKTLETKIGVTWSNFAGLNTKFEKEKKEVMYEIVLAIYKYYLGDNIDKFCLDKSNVSASDKNKPAEYQAHHGDGQQDENRGDGQEEEDRSDGQQEEYHGDGQQEELYQVAVAIPQPQQLYEDLEQVIHCAEVEYYENPSQVPVQHYREPLSNCTGAPSTPTSRSRAAPASSASQPVPSSSRPSSSRHQRSPSPPPVLESNSYDMNKKATCKINVTNKSNIARNLVAVADSPFANPKKRKHTDDDDDDSVTPGWLKDVFTNPRETIPGRVQLLNWRYRSLNNTDRLCLTIADGTAVTKYVISDEDLEEEFKQADLYSVFEINEAEIIDGCILVLKDVSFLNRNYIQPIALVHDVVALTKEFFDNLFVEKEMVVDGKKLPDHPGFTATPVVTRARARRVAAPAPKKLKAGGYMCDRCNKKSKTLSRFNAHICN